MRSGELAVAILLPLLGLILATSLIWNAHRQHQRAEERNKRWSQRYGSRAGQRLENQQRIWRMFGMDYPGAEEDLVSSSDEDTQFDPRGHQIPHHRRTKRNPVNPSNAQSHGTSQGTTQRPPPLRAQTGQAQAHRSYGTLDHVVVDTSNSTQASTASGSQRNHESRGSFGHEIRKGSLEMPQPTVSHPLGRSSTVPGRGRPNRSLTVRRYPALALTTPAPPGPDAHASPQRARLCSEDNDIEVPS
ncbi:hypothetical protein DFH27DRAFT_20424 [Peziza echinospora]|nr:hypothetical protein DFH27DRAFT_20424 [Peziza echinospora]